jgi:hypothetical protein
MFYYSRDRGGDHPARHLAGYASILQADAYGGYNKLYEAARKPGPIIEATCWAHARRPFFILADLAANARRKAQGKPASVISPLALRGIALGRKSWLFAGSDRGGQRAAAIYSLIVTAKLNEIDPHAWLADVLACIAGHPAHRIDDLLPWNWKKLKQQAAAA